MTNIEVRYFEGVPAYLNQISRNLKSTKDNQLVKYECKDGYTNIEHLDCLRCNTRLNSYLINDTSVSAEEYDRVLKIVSDHFSII